MNIVWILIWYAVCALLIVGFWFFYKLVNYSRFRDADGEGNTNQIGYEEDAVGNPLRLNNDDEIIDSSVPHTETF